MSLEIDIKNTALMNQIKFITEPTVLIPGSDLECSGYFSSNLRELRVNNSHPNYLEVLIHESCHMDQFLENTELWNSYLSLPSLAGWINHDFQLDMKEIYFFKEKLIQVEYDCELRSLHKILKYNQKIDKDFYSQKANAYLYALNLVFKYRKWIKNDPSLYNEIVMNMSKDLTLNFDTSLEELFLKKCFT